MKIIHPYLNAEVSIHCINLLCIRHLKFRTQQYLNHLNNSDRVSVQENVRNIGGLQIKPVNYAFVPK